MGLPQWGDGGGRTVPSLGQLQSKKTPTRGGENPRAGDKLLFQPGTSTAPRRISQKRERVCERGGETKIPEKEISSSWEGEFVGSTTKEGSKRTARNPRGLGPKGL